MCYFRHCDSNLCIAKSYREVCRTSCGDNLSLFGGFGRPVTPFALALHLSLSLSLFAVVFVSLNPCAIVMFLLPGLARVTVFFVQVSNVSAKLSRDRLSSVQASIGSLQVYPAPTK